MHALISKPTANPLIHAKTKTTDVDDKTPDQMNPRDILSFLVVDMEKVKSSPLSITKIKFVDSSSGGINFVAMELRLHRNYWDLCVCRFHF